MTKMTKTKLIKRIAQANIDPIVQLAKELHDEGITQYQLHSLLKNTEYSSLNPIGNKLINSVRDLECMQRPVKIRTNRNLQSPKPRRQQNKQCTFLIFLEKYPARAWITKEDVLVETDRGPKSIKTLTGNHKVLGTDGKFHKVRIIKSQKNIGKAMEKDDV